MLRIDPDRLRADFEALAAIGATSEGGVSRPAFSDAHRAARAWFLERAAAGGLETSVDSAGNHSASLPSKTPGARLLLLGSHLDSVPDGGRYDGSLGVLAALEVVRTIAGARLELPVALEAIDFTDEEGTVVGLLGSRALVGTLTNADLAAPRGGRAALLAGLAAAELTESGLIAARRRPDSLAGYLELHIEQGPVLERDSVDIGIVTGIVGSRSFRVVFVGEARHAGTTPMETRRDAGVGAAKLLLAARELVTSEFPGCVATVGDLRLEPGAFNVVPGRARLTLECRSLDPVTLDRLAGALLERARLEADGSGLSVEIEPVGRWDAVGLDTGVRAAIGRAASALAVSTVELTSGAGHDAQVLAAITPSGMIFVPSVGGISHHPDEETLWQDCVNGANVLLGAALELAG